MDKPLSAGGEPTRQSIGIGVSAQEKRLIEEKSRRPDRRGTPEPGKDPFRREELKVKEEKGPEEDGRREEPHALSG